MKRSKLRKSIERRDLEAVRTLLAAGAPLEWSRWRGFLLRDEQTPLQLAAAVRCVPIAELLLNHGADPDGGNPQRFRPLSIACVQGDIPMMELLVARGASVNGVPGTHFPSPIGVAATRRHMEVVNWLLEHGADPSAAFSSSVPIHQASLPILQRLIEAGGQAPADIEKAVRSGKW